MKKLNLKGLLVLITLILSLGNILEMFYRLCIECWINGNTYSFTLIGFILLVLSFIGVEVSYDYIQNRLK